MGDRTPVIVGIDIGGTKDNVTVLDAAGRFLIDRMIEVPSRVVEGTEPALEAMEQVFHLGLAHCGVDPRDVAAVGLDTPGPASAAGVISSRGAVNFSLPEWWGFDVRGALEQRLGVPVVYLNDGNAAALYAHHQHFGATADTRSSIAAIVGTGLGGGVVENGRVVSGAAGMAGELGHIHVPLDGLLEADQPAPTCNCGLRGDVESVASLTGIRNNLLPYWLSRYPRHPLSSLPIAEAALAVRGMAEQGDELSLHIFRQQAMAIGRLFTIAANFTDPHAYFVGGGVVEAAPAFREWFLTEVSTNTLLRDEQRAVSTIAVIPDLDMAGARGAAVAARSAHSI